MSDRLEVLLREAADAETSAVRLPAASDLAAAGRRRRSTAVALSTAAVAGAVGAAVVLAGAFDGGVRAQREQLGTEASSSPAPVAPVGCADLPHLWNTATIVNYDPAAGLLRFVWADGSRALLHDTDPGCPGQPGLAEELRSDREGGFAANQRSCQELVGLVEARQNGDSLPPGYVEKMAGQPSPGPEQLDLAAEGARECTAAYSVVASPSPYPEGACVALQPGDPIDGAPPSCPDPPAITSTMDCQAGTYVRIVRLGRVDLEGIIGLTPTWRAAGPIDPRYGRTEWTFQNCQEH